MNIQEFKKMAMALPEVLEEPHFHKSAFKIMKKIFVTLDSTEKTATFKLSLENQDLFSLIDKKNIYAAPNKWGKMGWTVFEIEFLESEIIKEVLKVSYSINASNRLVETLK
jgi:predicted DNA-binding protein (MmcQ/YjbR family)